MQTRSHGKPQGLTAAQRTTETVILFGAVNSPDQQKGKQNNGNNNNHNQRQATPSHKNGQGHGIRILLRSAAGLHADNEQ